MIHEILDGNGGAFSGHPHPRRLSSRVFFFLFPLLFLSTGLLPMSAPAAGGDTPFQPGEKLAFAVTWGFIPVGEGTLQVMPATRLNGVEAMHFSMTVQTNRFGDIFYRVRDRMEGFTDKEMTRSLLYKKISEGKSRRNVTVTYDWEEKRARYFNHGEEHASVTLLPGSYDPLSMFYALRFFDLEVGRGLTLPVSDGKKTVAGEASVKERSVIDVRGVDYDTFLVRVDTKDLDGVFKKSRDAELLIWVTADKRRMPVRIKSSVYVGSFTVDLVSHGPLNQ